MTGLPTPTCPECARVLTAQDIEAWERRERYAKRFGQALIMHLAAVAFGPILLVLREGRALADAVVFAFCYGVPMLAVTSLGLLPTLTERGRARRALGTVWLRTSIALHAPLVVFAASSAVADLASGSDGPWSGALAAATLLGYPLAPIVWPVLWLRKRGCSGVMPTLMESALTVAAAILVFAASVWLTFLVWPMKFADLL